MKMLVQKWNSVCTCSYMFVFCGMLGRACSKATQVAIRVGGEDLLDGDRNRKKMLSCHF